jgi:hypothetical protein
LGGLVRPLNDPPAWFNERPQLQRPQFSISSNRAELIHAAMPDLAEKGQQAIERFMRHKPGLVDGVLRLAEPFKKLLRDLLFEGDTVYYQSASR